MYVKVKSLPKADKKDKTYVQKLLPMDTMIVSIIVGGKTTLTKKSVIGEA